MNKLWAFGCSHTQGTEVGIEKYIDPDSWIKSQLGDTHFQFMSEKQKGMIQRNWLEVLNSIWETTDVENEGMKLSFSGRIAEKLGLELKNNAIKGSGADRALHELLKCKDDIDWNNDVVFVGMTYPYRFMVEEDDRKMNRNLNYAKNHKDKKQRHLHQAMVEFGPTDFSWDAWNSGIYHLIKTQFPNVHIIDTTGKTNKRMKWANSKIVSNTKNLHDFAKYDIIDGIKCYDLYPHYHFKTYAHEHFAEYLITELNL